MLLSVHFKQKNSLDANVSRIIKEMARVLCFIVLCWKNKLFPYFSTIKNVCLISETSEVFNILKKYKHNWSYDSWRNIVIKKGNFRGKFTKNSCFACIKNNFLLCEYDIKCSVEYSDRKWNDANKNLWISNAWFLYHVKNRN